MFWVSAIAAANVLVFIAFGMAGNGWMNADSEALIRWGSNFGPQTLSGEPWRLASSMFLHGGLVHLAVNMFTLFDLGRLCEMFFGRARFPVLYVLSGLAGSLASVYWNPLVNSVGASGAICGVLGAMLVFMLDSRNRVPVAMLKSHATGIGIFLIYSVVMGVSDAPIDHAAHAGGLVGGGICAYVLSRWHGTAFAATGSVVIVGVLASLLIFAPGAAPEKIAARNAARDFTADLRWFGPREKELMAISQALVPKWQEVDSKKQLRELSSQWDEIHRRFSAYRFEPEAEQARLHQLMLQYLDLRRRVYKVLVDMPPAAASKEFERLSREMKQTVDDINALSKAR
ncbi:MAG: rhomboid family intramembrane serine protease [Burkholderiales bacterium]